MTKFEGLNKAYGVNAKACKEGKWWEVPNTNIAFLLKPANIHNIEFIRKSFEANLEDKFGDKWENQILFREEIRVEIAKLYFGTVVADYQYTDGQEKQGDITLEELVDIFVKYPLILKDITNYCVNIRNFEAVSEEDEKN